MADVFERSIFGEIQKQALLRSPTTFVTQMANKHDLAEGLMLRAHVFENAFLDLVATSEGFFVIPVILEDNQQDVLRQGAPRPLGIPLATPTEVVARSYSREIQIGVEACARLQLTTGPNQGLPVHTAIAQTEVQPGTVVLKNRCATLGLVFGIASAFFFEFLIPGPAAIVLSVVGIRRASSLAAAGNRAVGRGPAIAGLILGIIYTLLPLLKVALTAIGQQVISQ
jgi:hypothetical protein